MCLLYVPVNARLQIFIQLPATLMNLCHIKHDHLVHIRHFLAFFPNSSEFLVQILHTYCMFLSALDYKFLPNYIQL